MRAAVLALVGAALVGPRAQEVDPQPDYHGAGIFRLHEDIVDGDVFIFPSLPFIGQVKVADKGCDVGTAAAGGCVDQATDNPQVHGGRRLDSTDLGRLVSEPIKRHLGSDPSSSSLVLREDDLTEAYSSADPFSVTSIPRGWACPDNKDVGTKIDGLRWSLPEILVDGLEVEPSDVWCRSQNWAGAPSRNVGNGRDFQPGACARGQGVLCYVGLPAGFGVGAGSEYSSGDGGSGRYDRSGASDGPIPALPPLVAFIGGALGIVGALAMICAFKREGPIWVTLCGYALAAGGGAAALIAALPWLWRLAA